MLPMEMWQIIFDELDFLSKIRLRQVHPLLMGLSIVDLYYIDDKYLERLNDEILLQHPYTKYLFAFDNIAITTVNHLHDLERLDASWDCGIDDKGLQVTNILVLDANGNEKIKDIRHLGKLQSLLACYRCGISDEDIKDLPLKSIDADGNSKITTI